MPNKYLRETILTEISEQLENQRAELASRKRERKADVTEYISFVKKRSSDLIRQHLLKVKDTLAREGDGSTYGQVNNGDVLESLNGILYRGALLYDTFIAESEKEQAKVNYRRGKFFRDEINCAINRIRDLLKLQKEVELLPSGTFLVLNDHKMDLLTRRD
jgi:hypothetical protein